MHSFLFQVFYCFSGRTEVTEIEEIATFCSGLASYRSHTGVSHWLFHLAWRNFDYLSPQRSLVS